jgi:hypothetical protein
MVSTRWAHSPVLLELHVFITISISIAHSNVGVQFNMWRPCRFFAWKFDQKVESSRVEGWSAAKMFYTMSPEPKKYKIFNPSVLRMVTTSSILTASKMFFLWPPHRNEECSELFQCGVQDWQVVQHWLSSHLWWFCDDAQSSFVMILCFGSIPKRWLVERWFQGMTAAEM